jgi:hypothetical protein
MRTLAPSATRDQTTKVFIPKELNSCTHVWVRCDGTRRPLQPPYDGPFKIIKRHSKHFIIDKAGKRDTVLIDRLKPAFIDAADQSESTAEPPRSASSAIPLPGPSESPPNPASSAPSPKPRSTRSGRHVHFPKRFADVIYYSP